MTRRKPPASPKGAAVAPPPVAKADKVRAEVRSALRELDAAFDVVANALGDLDNLVEPDDPLSEGEPLSARAAKWLDRQRLLGLISPEGAAAVERLIGDLG